MDASYERIRTLYHENMYLRGKKSLFQDSEGMFTGIISHVETDGHLVIIDEQSQSRRYAFKQVQFIRDDKD
jgi:BirA family biotin operon repressor/biotin-[acetyl-CoA-carboxylase] ligase